MWEKLKYLNSKFKTIKQAKKDVSNYIINFSNLFTFFKYFNCN